MRLRVKSARHWLSSIEWMLPCALADVERVHSASRKASQRFCAVTRTWVPSLSPFSRCHGRLGGCMGAVAGMSSG